MPATNPLIMTSDGYEVPVSNTSSSTNTKGFVVLGSDGTTNRILVVDSSGRNVIVGAGVAGTPAGGVLSIQGISGGQAITITGSVTTNIGTTNGLALDATLAKLTISPGTALGTNTVAMMGGSVTTAAPSYTTGQINALSLTTSGLLRVDGSGVTQPISGSVTVSSGAVTVSQSTAANLNATVVGGSSDNTANSTSKLPVIVGRANAADPSWTEGNMVPLSVDLTGYLRVDERASSQTGATPPAYASLMGGSVTTAAPTYTTGQLNSLSLTTTGLLRVDGSGVTQPVSGTVTANQGTANTLANAWSMKITDATNGPAAVKAASTAPAATDPALVVTMSPNSSSVSTATLSNVASSATSVTLLAANTNRKAVILVNDSTQVLFVKFGTTASSTSYTYRMIANGTLELPQPIYTGIITGIWASANGAARLTEMSP